MLKCILFLCIGLIIGCMVGVCIMCLARSAGQADLENAEEEDKA